MSFYHARSIDDISHKGHPFVVDFLLVRNFDGRVVLVLESPFHKERREGGLSHTSVAQQRDLTLHLLVGVLKDTPYQYRKGGRMWSKTYDYIHANSPPTIP